MKSKIVSILFYYGDVLWKAAGVSEQWALRINLLTGLVNILAAIVSVFFVWTAVRETKGKTLEEM